ncbi:MAG: ABC transporter ATP-binding protein [Gemmatimonadales bacterium]|nr:ABC transporter ATP-binding protein [Gemmatimonadales bacterium]
MIGVGARLEDVHCGYGGGDVLRGVSLDVAAGESVALLGANGAGKTTLTRLLVGLIRPSAGRVTVGDWDAGTKRPDEMARRVGYAFQHADQQLFARTVREDVAFGPLSLGLSKDGVAWAMDELDLLAVAEVHPYDLPAPARKLVTLAGVLAMRPGLLVLDEPTAGFDRKRRELVIGALRRRLAEGVTVLVVSHDLGFVAEIAERIAVMKEGAIAADSPARELLRDVDALGALGLAPPPAAALGLRLALPGAPVRIAECAEALRGARWRAAGV